MNFYQAVTAMIVPASLHPGASAAAFDALAVAASRDVLSAVGFRPCLDAAVTIVERHSKVSYVRLACRLVPTGCSIDLHCDCLTTLACSRRWRNWVMAASNANVPRCLCIVASQ